MVLGLAGLALEDGLEGQSIGEGEAVGLQEELLGEGVGPGGALGELFGQG